MDTAFAKVLADEFGRLTAGMTSSQIDNWLRQSEQSILRLRNGSDMPDYSDPMVVLWYAIQYQMGHINRAYTLIKMDLGKKWWEEFANEAGHHTGLNFLTEAAKLMHWSGFHEQYHSVRKF